MSALHQFFCAQQLIAANCKQCGKLAAVYRGHAHGDACAECDGWRKGRCRCAGLALPSGDQLAELKVKARAAQQRSHHRARIRIYV
ncbi:hypothetical protein L2K20_03520 [Mycobacterium sp. MBM]|nr:hypothetical protein [Mycobacterium sp. MBM]